jgi:phosphinothricin acetyltransferase
MILRAARPEDAPAICRIANAIIRDTLVTFTTRERHPDEVILELARPDTVFLVAEQTGRVIGFASFGPFRSGPGYARTREHTIHLAPDARGQGTGRNLMHRLESIAAASGFHVLVAGISSANPAGIAFHAGLGFSQVGLMPQVGLKHGRWLDLVLMQKILRPGPDSAPDSGAVPL